MWSAEVFSPHFFIYNRFGIRFLGGMSVGRGIASGAAATAHIQHGLYAEEHTGYEQYPFAGVVHFPKSSQGNASAEEAHKIPLSVHVFKGTFSNRRGAETRSFNNLMIKNSASLRLCGEFENIQ